MQSGDRPASPRSELRSVMVLSSEASRPSPVSRRVCWLRTCRLSSGFCLLRRARDVNPVMRPDSGRYFAAGRILIKEMASIRPIDPANKGHSVQLPGVCVTSCANHDAPGLCCSRGLQAILSSSGGHCQRTSPTTTRGLSRFSHVARVGSVTIRSFCSARVMAAW